VRDALACRGGFKKTEMHCYLAPSAWKWRATQRQMCKSSWCDSSPLFCKVALNIDFCTAII